MYVESGSATKVRIKFWHKFQVVTVPHREIIHILTIINELR